MTEPPALILNAPPGCMVTVPAPKSTPPEVYTLYGLLFPLKIAAPNAFTVPPAEPVAKSPADAVIFPLLLILSVLPVPIANLPDCRFNCGMVVPVVVSVTVLLPTAPVLAMVNCPGLVILKGRPVPVI